MNYSECLSCDCTFSDGCRAEQMANIRTAKGVPKADQHPKHANRKAGRPRGQGPIQLFRKWKTEQQQLEEKTHG